ncbi:hypothetical protein [Sulfurimonas sp.]
MLNFIIIFFTMLISFTACSSQNEKEITIATNQWIGYAPLFYANETGALDTLHIKLFTNVSLAEAADLYDIGKVDMVTTTQHEYNALKKSTHDIVPIILIDRSNGGDMILANKSLQELKKANKIYTYLEVDSINNELLQDFIKHNNIDKNKIIYINKDQKQIQDVRNEKNKTILIVTYSPYDISLKKKGFKELASTKEIQSLIVVDSLCAKNTLIQNDRQRLIALKKVIDQAIDTIQQDPRASYEKVKKYLSNMSYNDYMTSLHLIKWINKPSAELLDYIQRYGYSKENIIQ